MGYRLVRTAIAVLAGAAVLFGGSDDAFAQAKQRTLFDMLFKRDSAEPAPRTKPRLNKKPRKKKSQTVVRKVRKKRATESTPAPRLARRSSPKAQVAVLAAKPQEPVVVEKIESAKTVLVVGDFMAGGLAEGLTDAFAALPGVRVMPRTNGSSGFVRNDFYDWSEEISILIDEVKPAAVIMMIGSNDRQKMQVGSVREEIRSEKWDAEYARRADAFAAAVKAKNVPLLWVGMPPFRFRSMATDMLALNDEYRRATESAGGTFVDIWDGFVDAEGNFVTRGPDINGQEVQLRSSDGINMTSAGRRKMAFYTEKELKKTLGTALDPTIGTLTKENLPALVLSPAEPSGPAVRTPPIALADPALDGGDELLGASVTARSNSLLKTPADTFFLDGVAPQSQPGRVNDFSWPPRDLPQSATPKL